MHTHRHTHSHKSRWCTCMWRAKGHPLLSGIALVPLDKRLIHLITFNESSAINRHRLTHWHFSEADNSHLLAFRIQKTRRSRALNPNHMSQVSVCESVCVHVRILARTWIYSNSTKPKNWLSCCWGTLPIVVLIFFYKIYVWQLMVHSLYLQSIMRPGCLAIEIFLWLNC